MDMSTMIRDAVFGIGTITLDEALVAEPLLINVLDDVGNAPLHWAIRLNQVETVKVLIQHDADIEIRDQHYGFTPLLIAARVSVNMVPLLLESGASAGAMDFQGCGVLYWCTDIDMARILIRAGADPNRGYDKRKETPLHRIADSIVGPNSSPPTRRHLGFDPNELPPGHGLMPDVIGLISELARADANYDAKDVLGRTPFLAAVGSENVTALWHLYKLGARVDTVDHDGWDLIVHVAVTRPRLLEVVECCRAMNVTGIDPDRSFKYSGTTWSSVVVFNHRMSFSQGPGAQRPAQIEVFAFYALITEIRDRNWEAGLFLETKEELEAQGYVNGIRKWLGWQWHMIHDDDEFACLVWDTKYDIWPEYFTEDEDSIDYDTRLLWVRIESAENGVDLSDQGSEDEDSEAVEEFFDATE